ncbi:MAG: dual specificity protein phosphatase family protein [Anaerolineaceae bacterium]|nr:dual specificity protein phosphatase family protein [Anaerolineaceae bacterium]
MTTITRIPLALKGSVFRSPLPFGAFDPAEEALNELVAERVEVLFSLIQEHEWMDKATRDARPDLRANQILIHAYPIEDFLVPADGGAFLAEVKTAIRLAGEGKNIAVHCNAGFGRTGMFLAEMAIQVLRLPVDDAVHWLREYIPTAVENDYQYQFLRDLHRNG